MPRIFISYRRSDAAGTTGRIYDRLVSEFGRENIFKDVDSIPLGVDFSEHLDYEVSRCEVVLVIMGKAWATVTESDGSFRLDSPHDFVRIEIESALNRGIPVIPVLLDGVVMPTKNQLPSSLQPLTLRNGVSVGQDPRFHTDVERLIKGLKSLIPGSAVVPTYFFREAEKWVQSYEDYHRKTVVDFYEDLGHGVFIHMIEIPGGKFLMGSPANEHNRQKSEGPQHKVRVPPFLIGETPITQAQWAVIAQQPKIRRTLHPFPSKFTGDLLPVEQIQWAEAVEFCNRLSRHTGCQYRLPSESEWEYACRAGIEEPFYCGEFLDAGTANYGKNIGQTSEIGNYPPNAFGLYDMHGNVWEWCRDRWHKNYKGAPADGSGWGKSCIKSQVVLRGGSWNSAESSCRSASRFRINLNLSLSTIGFRVSCSST